MNKNVLLGLLIIVVSGATAGQSFGELTEFPPSDVVCAPQVGTTATAVLQFDVASITVANINIDAAYLECELSGFSHDVPTGFSALAIEDSWTSDSVSQGVIPSLDPESMSEWEITPADFEVSGGLVRLDVTSIVRSWVDGNRENHGIALQTLALSPAALGAQLQAAHLYIRHALVGR